MCIRDRASKPQLSTEAQAKAQTIVNTVVPASFTKQQRREVQKAIEKGMATVRAQTNNKNREREKKAKQLQKQLAAKGDDTASTAQESPQKLNVNVILPWGLLALTWIGLAVYLIRG